MKVFRTENTIISKTAAYIEENLGEDLCLDKIAESVNYSKFYLNRMFEKETGQTIYQYIKLRRLSAAAKMLEETDTPVSEIALEANYGSQQAFALAFRQVYLCAPQSYRNRFRKHATYHCRLELAA